MHWSDIGRMQRSNISCMWGDMIHMQRSRIDCMQRSNVRKWHCLSPRLVVAASKWCNIFMVSVMGIRGIMISVAIGVYILGLLVHRRIRKTRVFPHYIFTMPSWRDVIVRGDHLIFSLVWMHQIFRFGTVIRTSARWIWHCLFSHQHRRLDFKLIR
ncbi:hypothetical protein D3C77_320730 [compost metagenome]